MEIVRDKSIISRIGVGKDEWLVMDGCDDVVSLDSSSCMDDADDEEVDNLRCDADFEKVDDGYHGVDGFMAGAIRKMRKGNGDGYSTCVGIYTADGMHKVESARGATAYLGRDGMARCLAIPQCKMMNSTVLDGDHVRRTVYVGRMDSRSSNGTFGASGMQGDDGVGWLRRHGFHVTGTHTPFSMWCVMGAVLGKALRVWRGVAKMDMGRMPTWMYVGIPEVFEALNPGCRWLDLSGNSRMEWIRGIVDTFSMMRENGMAWDLPSDGGRTAYWTRSILESSLVSRRVDARMEKPCRREWGDVYEPCGFKVRIRGNAIFGFCWRRNVNSPSVVQIRRYEHDVRKVLGTRGWTRCFHMIWASWLVQYRNYWKRRNGGYASCELEWSQREMLKAFGGGAFEDRHLSTDEMVRILEYHTQRHVFSHGERRPAHIDRVFVSRRCVVGWTMPKSISGEDVIVKNGAGMNLGLEDSGVSQVPPEVRFAESRMREINEANSRHVVTLDGRRLDTHESVIYGTETRNGRLEIASDRNGRCYSMRHGIQALHRDDRSRVLIDGRRTVEVDYSSLHPHILYALNGLDCRGDVYDVGRWWQKWGLGRDEARLACKMMMLRVINARRRIVAMYSFKRAWNAMNGVAKGDYIPWMYELYDAIARRHRAIAHEFCTGRGVYLMNMDGRLIREVCHRLAREGMCALAVHDSVVVESRHARKVAGIMREEYSKMFGKRITVRH